MKKLFSFLLVGAAFCSSAQAAETSTLDKVMESKVLRVCTTGDYKPYTFLKEDGSYEGIDISMADLLAESLGAKAEFVKTSWKEMMPDFLAGKCDIAMGGVSVSLARQKVAAFTIPLDVDGKVPFVRCDDVEKYQTIEQLNNENVRAIEPAGGTNEAFVRQHMPKAKLELFHDNTIIFKNLVENKADVMITEASEALYQKKFYPSLCVVNPDKQLNFAEKGYMVSRGDVAFKNYVDQWLHIAKNNGDYNKITAEWLGAK